MNNFWLFLITTFSYWGIWLMSQFVFGTWLGPWIEIRHSTRVFTLIALLSLPLNFGSVVVTVIGSAQGENVVSVFSPYQKAEKTSFGLIGSIIQTGRYTGIFFGVSGYQKADSLALVFFGIGGYQKANYEATNVLGISIYQSVSGRSEWFRAFGSTKERLN